MDRSNVDDLYVRNTHVVVLKEGISHALISDGDEQWALDECISRFFVYKYVNCMLMRHI